jgi:hypothetical protein
MIPVLWHRKKTKKTNQRRFKNNRMLVGTFKVFHFSKCLKGTSALGQVPFGYTKISAQVFQLSKA